MAAEDEYMASLEKALADNAAESAVASERLKIELDGLLEIQRTTKAQIMKIRRKLVGIDLHHRALKARKNEYEEHVALRKHFETYKFIIGTKVLGIKKDRLCLLNAKGKTANYKCIVTPVELRIVKNPEGGISFAPSEELQPIIDYVTQYTTFNRTSYDIKYKMTELSVATSEKQTKFIDDLFGNYMNIYICETSQHPYIVYFTNSDIHDSTIVLKIDVTTFTPIGKAPAL